MFNPAQQNEFLKIVVECAIKHFSFIVFQFVPMHCHWMSKNWIQTRILKNADFVFAFCKATLWFHSLPLQPYLCGLITYYVSSPPPLNSQRIESLASYSFIIQFWFIQRRMYHKYMSSIEWMTNSTAKWNVGLYGQTTHRCKCARAAINYASLCGVRGEYVQSWCGSDLLFNM